VKKEPRMDAFAAIVDEPIPEEPTVAKQVLEDSVKAVAEPESVKVDPIPAEDNSPIEEATPRVEITSPEPVEEPIEKPPVEKATIEESSVEEPSIEEPIAAGIEDEITNVDIPTDLAVAEAEIHVGEITEDEAPAQEKMPLDIEPLVLSVIVHAEEDEFFQGPEIREALEAEGLTHGAMSIFHFHDPDKEEISENDDAVFSVANVLEPGFFDLGKLEELQSPGLMLFCQLPGPLPGEAALDLMLDKGRGLAVRLGGHMCDDKRNPFTTQAKNYYRDRISTFARELELARKKAEA
jgi:cell division protein ZipA